MSEAELLFTEILNCDRLFLYKNRRLFLDKQSVSLISAVLKRRILGEPLEYILGKTEFMGFEFNLSPDVFISRPETEILVETALRMVYQSFSRDDGIRALDIGTGSGCIAISLAKLLSNLRIDAIDISKEALRISKENARLHKVRINFIQSDLFNTHHLTPNSYDLIIGNPPYIPTTQINNLQPEIRYEPRIALDGGRDGLDFYRRIITQSPFYLKGEGFLILEIGYNQKKAIEGIFKKSGKFKILEVVRDYSNIERVIVAKSNS